VIQSNNQGQQQKIKTKAFEKYEIDGMNEGAWGTVRCYSNPCASSGRTFTAYESRSIALSMIFSFRCLIIVFRNSL